MSAPSTPSRQPVEINAGKNLPTVEIVWDDDHRTKYQVSELRALCPCATCREAGGDPAHQGIVSKSSAENKPRRSLPLFKAEKYQITDMHYVGNYALGISWLDKHQSIFPWQLLSDECPCSVCAARRQENTSA
jgi:DUF971 family protein